MGGCVCVGDVFLSPPARHSPDKRLVQSRRQRPVPPAELGPAAPGGRNGPGAGGPAAVRSARGRLLLRQRRALRECNSPKSLVPGLGGHSPPSFPHLQFALRGLEFVALFQRQCPKPSSSPILPGKHAGEVKAAYTLHSVHLISVDYIQSQAKSIPE